MEANYIMKHLKSVSYFANPVIYFAGPEWLLILYSVGEVP